MKTRILSLTEHLSFLAVVLLLMIVCWRPEYDNNITYEHASSQSQKWDGVPRWVVAKPTWTRCEFEDSNNCVWNAKRMGLGGGASYVATSKGRVIYVKHWQAYRLLRPAYAE